MLQLIWSSSVLSVITRVRWFTKQPHHLPATHMTNEPNPHAMVKSFSHFLSVTRISIPTVSTAQCFCHPSLLILPPRSQCSYGPFITCSEHHWFYSLSNPLHWRPLFLVLGSLRRSVLETRIFVLRLAPESIFTAPPIETRGRQRYCRNVSVLPPGHTA